MRRVLSVISLLGGSGIAIYSGYLAAIGIFAGEFLTRNVIFLAVGVLLVAGGVLGNITAVKRNCDLTDEQRERLKRRRQTTTIAIGAVFVLTVFCVALPVMLQLNEGETFDAAFRPMMMDTYTQTGVPLPDNARYILYNVNKQEFEADSGTLLKGISGNQKCVNVVVTYQITTSNIGVWETAGGATIASAYEESMKLSVVRLSDWSLVEEKTFVAVHSKNRLGKGDKKYTYQISLYDDEVTSYLNGLFGK